MQNVVAESLTRWVVADYFRCSLSRVKYTVEIKK